MGTSRLQGVAFRFKAVGFEQVRAIAIAMWRRFNDRRLIGLASESAFWLLLALVPLAAVSGMFAARFVVSNGAAFGLISHSLPPEARELVTTELGKVASYNGGRLGLVASVVCIWLASSGVHAIFDVFEAAAESHPRSWVKKRALSIACCVALAVGMAVIAVLIGDLDQVAKVVNNGSPHALSRGEVTIRWTLGAVVDLLLTTGLYRVGVIHKGRHTTLFPGAILAVVLQIALGAGYAVFIRELGDGSTYLAGLAVFGVTMTALFIYMVSLLLGLTLNAVIADNRRADTRARLFGDRLGVVQ